MDEHSCCSTETDSERAGVEDEVKCEHGLCLFCLGLQSDISISCIICQLAVVVGIASGYFLRSIELLGENEAHKLMREYQSRE